METCLEELLANISKKAKHLRKERNLTQLELALKTGMDRNQISRIENAENSLNVKTILKLTQFYDIEFNEFFDFKNIK